MKLYHVRLKVGSHYHNGALVDAPATITSPSPLHKMFPDKFTLDSQPVTAAAVEASLVQGEGAPHTDTDKTLAILADAGTAVSDRFAYSAKDTGLLVFKKGTGKDTRYFVYDQDDMTGPLNPVGLRKSKVEEYILSQSQG